MLPDITYSGYNKETSEKERKKMRSLIKSEVKVPRSTHYTAAPFRYHNINVENQIFSSERYGSYFTGTSVGLSYVARQTQSDI